MNGLTCPKCQGSMRSYERSGITVDQCTECRGIFLDRGELERLVDAENSHYSGYEQRHADPEYREPAYRRDPEYREQHGYAGGHGYGHGHKKHRRRSFLEELFD